jgi:hypothetical protein
MLVRRGLAIWAQHWRATPSTPLCLTKVQSLGGVSPMPPDNRTELTKLLASLILSPIKEDRYART